MKIYLTLFLLLFVNIKVDSKKISPKEERILIEKSLSKSEKEIEEITRIFNEKNILKNK